MKENEWRNWNEWINERKKEGRKEWKKYFVSFCFGSLSGNFEGTILRHAYNEFCWKEIFFHIVFSWKGWEIVFFLMLFGKHPYDCHTPSNHRWQYCMHKCRAIYVQILATFWSNHSFHSSSLRLKLQTPLSVKQSDKIDLYNLAALKYFP